MLSYAEAVTAVIQQMREPDSKCKDIRMSSICYQALFKYLVLNGIPFSMDAAVNWLETKKKDICTDTYSAYRRALFRLEHYLLFGNIDVPFCASEEAFLCRSGMSESFFRLNYELKEYRILPYVFCGIQRVLSSSDRNGNNRTRSNNH